MVPLDKLRQKGTPPVSGSNLGSRRDIVCCTLSALRSGVDFTDMTEVEALATTGLNKSRGIRTVDEINVARIFFLFAKSTSSRQSKG